MFVIIKVYFGYGEIGVGVFVKLVNFRRWWIVIILNIIV